MSYTTILAVYPGDRTEAIEELGNSWLSAPLVWEAIKDRYAPHEYSLRYSQAFWNLYREPNVEPFERALLAMTFDRAYVVREDYWQAAKDIDTFMDKRGVGGHWFRIRDVFASDPNYPAIGFWFTSVSDNPFNGQWNDEKQAHDPPNWDHSFNLYEELRKVAEAEHASN